MSTYLKWLPVRLVGSVRGRSPLSTAWGVRLTLEELLLRHATGEDVSALAREPDASGVMMIPIPQRGVFREVRGVEHAERVPGISEVRITAKHEAMLVPLPEGRSYLGFIFARGATAADVERALREAHTMLDFVIEREVPIFNLQCEHLIDAQIEDLKIEDDVT